MINQIYNLYKYVTNKSVIQILRFKYNAGINNLTYSIKSIGIILCCTCIPFCTLLLLEFWLELLQVLYYRTPLTGLLNSIIIICEVYNIK